MKRTNRSGEGEEEPCYVTPDLSYGQEVRDEWDETKKIRRAVRQATLNTSEDESDDVSTVIFYYNKVASRRDRWLSYLSLRPA